MTLKLVPHVNPTDAEVRALAAHIYKTECQNELMPDWPDVPTIYARGCLNDAANRLGWRPVENDLPSR